MLKQLYKWIKTHILHRNSVKTLVVFSVLILIGCMLAATGMIEAVTRSKMKASILESNRETAQFLCSYLDLEVRHINNTLYNYLSDTSLNAITVERDRNVEYINDIQRVSKTVSRTVSENKLIDDLVILFHDVPYVISKEGHFSKDYYYQHHMFVEKILSMDKQELETVQIIPRFRKTVLEGDRIVEKEVILFCIAAKRYTLALLVDTETLTMMVQTGMQTQNNQLVIVSGTELIYNQSGIDNNVLLQNSDFMQGKEQVEINGEGFFLTGVHSESFDWDYIILHPVSALNQEVAAVSTPYKYLYFTIILVCGGLLVWYQRKILIPIRKLTSATYDDSLQFQQEEFILLGNLRHQNQQLNDFVSYNIQMSRRRILENLIINRLALEEKEEKNYFADMNRAFYVLAKVVAIECADIAVLRKEIERQMTGQDCCFLSLGLVSDSFYLLVNCDVCTEIMAVLQACLEYENIIGSEVFAAVASPVTSINDLANASSQIDSILSNRNINTNSCVFHIEDVIWRNLYTTRWKNMEQDLGDAMEIGNIRSFLKLYTMRGKNISYQEMRSFLLRIYHAVLSIAAAHELNKQQFVPDTFLLSESPQNKQLNLWKEELQLSQMLLRLSDLLKKDKDSASDRMIAEILAYIKENYNRYISLDLVAQKFDMNANYLSVYIKRHLGMTFTEYMEKLRMDKARQLMNETDMTVSEISAELGFDSPSSFIRFFRKKEGITPGAYKKGKEAKRV